MFEHKTTAVKCKNCKHVESVQVKLKKCAKRSLDAGFFVCFFFFYLATGHSFTVRFSVNITVKRGQVVTVWTITLVRSQKGWKWNVRHFICPVSKHSGSGGRSNVFGILFVQIPKQYLNNMTKKITAVQSMFQFQNTLPDVFHNLHVCIFNNNITAI